MDLSDTYVRPALKWRAVTVKGRLVLNLRGGQDIFERASPPPTYGQPPLSYYVAAAEAALAAHEISHIQIVHHDERNPVLGQLREAAAKFGVPIGLSSGGPRADAEAVLSAEHLVIGRSTFPEALALLSPGLVSLATFGMTHNEDALRCAAPVMRRFDHSGDYTVANRWLGTDVQRAEMLAYPQRYLSMTETKSSFGQRRDVLVSHPSVLRRIARQLRFG